MKKSIFIIAVLALAFCSCDRGENRGMLTQRGKRISEKWQDITGYFMRDVVNESFHLNAWINADDSLRRIIEEQYYNGKRVRVDAENVYGIYTDYDRLLMTVYTHGVALSDAGAVWEIHRLCMDDYTVSDCQFLGEPEVVFNLTAQGDNTWHLVVDTATSAGSALDLTLGFSGVAVPYDIVCQRFTLDGSGSYVMQGTTVYSGETVTENPVTLQFDIESTLCNALNYGSWDAGKVNFKAILAGHEDIPVTAVYTGDSGVLITYRGVTEQW